MEDLIKINNVKRYLNTQDVKCSKEFIGSINQEFIEYLDKVIDRTKLNGRTVVLTRDL